MPHIIVKLWPGPSEEDKKKLADKIVNSIWKTLRYEEEHVSVAIVEVAPQDWNEDVYQPDIVQNAKTLYKKPGYTM